MIQSVLLLIPVALILFWVWMFNDMLNNDDIPTISKEGLRWPPVSKNQWMVFFALFTIATAGFYYLTEYKNKHQG